jgi:DNA-binding NarL/FixJ family response regulator
VGVRVFLVDDHELVRLGVRAAVEAEEDLTVVGEAAGATEALACIAATRVDVAVVDLQLGQGDGIALCRELHGHHPEVRCLVLSAFSDQRDVLGALMAGAAGYVLKQRASRELVQAIRTVAAGGTVLDPGVAEGVLARMREGARPDPMLARLSAQERRILSLIAEGRTNREIADDLFLAEKTVRNYVSNLLAKLQMHRRSEAAAYAARLSERGEFPPVA